ncbi:alginate lyase [Sesbania bispinosa]|nr:alginate lyase [Sesbania bispinosa]
MWEEEGHLTATEGARWRGLAATHVGGCGGAGQGRGGGRRGYSHSDGLVTHDGDTVPRREAATASLSSSSSQFFCSDSLPLPGFLSLGFGGGETVAGVAMGAVAEMTAARSRCVTVASYEGGFLLL